MKKAFTVILSLFVLSALLISAACSSEPAAAPAPTAAPSKYPLTVVDMLGRSVQISQCPTRIVTTAPTATETLYRVGGTAVGVDSSSKYPEDVQGLSKVGSAYNISTEAIAALDPDLVIVEALNQANIISALENLGITVLAVRAASLEDINQSLTLVGKVVNMEDKAAQAIAEIQNRIEAAQKNVTVSANVLIFISDAQRNIYAAKPESYPGTVAALLGLSNPAAGLPDSFMPGFTLFTAEQALTSDADMVFTITPAPPPTPRLSASLTQIPGFNQMAAVKAGKVVELDPALFLQAQGPRIADAVEEMLRLIQEGTE
jgi:iron complex transport system substrate-binding protein